MLNKYRQTFFLINIFFIFPKFHIFVSIVDSTQKKLN